MTTSPPPGPLLAATTGVRVAVVTGSYGRGHDAAARELARHLGAAGCIVDVHDMVDLLPWRLGAGLRSAYYAQLRTRPGSWDTTLRHLEPGRTLHRLATAALAVGVSPTVRAVRGADLVITTHPFGAQVLGHARHQGRLTVPAVTYLTDTSVHAMWVHADIDLHLAIHDLAAAQARSYGGRAATVRPLVPSGLEATRQARDPLAALEILGPRALVTGGSLGVGELEAAAQDILDTGVMAPVVLCGTNLALRNRLSAMAGVVALGWRDDVPGLIAAADCVVQNAGGFTSLEALGVGTPVLTYRPLPGHGVANSANLEAAGLVPWARSKSELRAELLASLDQARVCRLPHGAPSVLEVLTGAAVESVHP
jgi:processive 1,2-diacylglycerol beta-glucosyltransferase